MVKGKRFNDILYFVGLVLVVILINYLSNFVFKRWDLTAEKRYSLSDATIDEVEKLDDILFVRVYLEGDLPANYKRLRDATQEMLDEFRAYNGNVEYEFIDPSANPEEKERVKVYEKLTKEGLKYTNIKFREGDKVAEKIIFPGAILSYKGTDIPIQLLKGQMGAPEEVIINNSIQQLEYEFALGFTKLTTLLKPKVAIIEGHGELDDLEIADFTRALQEFYVVDRVEINEQLNALKDYDAIVVAKPESAFAEKDKYIIDQFIMNGGKALWLVEHVFATMDSLQTNSTTMGIPRLLNLEDMLFNYGVRINTDLVMDLQALPIPIVTGYVGNQPRQEFFPWFYFPLVMPLEEHPIVKNLDAIKTQFVSSMDTVTASGIRKTPLLKTSRYSKIVMTPTRISLNSLREEPDERQYSKPPQTIAILLEGKFESNFKNRLPKSFIQNDEFNFKPQSFETKQIVIADGDIAANRVNRNKNQFFTLGFDRYTNRLYANKDFLLNCMNYLCNDAELLEARAKEFKIRLLDPKKIKSERNRWQLINTVIPVLFVLLFGLLHYYQRKKKYGA